MSLDFPVRFKDNDYLVMPAGKRGRLQTSCDPIGEYRRHERRAFHVAYILPGAALGSGMFGRGKMHD